VSVQRTAQTSRQDETAPFPRKSSGFQTSKLYSDTDAGRYGYRFMMQLAGDATLTRPYAQHPWVNACVSAIARAVSSVPLVVQRQTSDGEMEPVESGPLVDLFAMPNALMSQRKWLESISQTQSLYGETFLIMMTKENGVIRPIQPHDRIRVPDELWPVRGDLLEEIIDDKTQLPRAWRMATKAGSVELDHRSVVQIAQANPYNPLRGMGPMQAAYRTAAKDFVLDRYDEALLSNGGSPGGVLSVEGHLTDADSRAIAAAWREAHERPDQHRKTAVLPQGTTYEEIGFSPHEMEFEAMRAWNRETIMSVFGVTKPIIGLTEGLNYASSQSAFRAFWEVTVTPFLEFLADELQTKFVRRLIGPEQMYRVQFDTSGVAALREDADSKIERTLKLFAQGGRTFREAAELAGMNLDDVDLEHVEQAYMPVSQVPVFGSTPMAEPAEGEDAPQPEAAPAEGMEATADPSVSLNGAQIQSLLNLIEQYASGRLPKDTVVQLIIAAFPFDQARAERILAEVAPGSIPSEDEVRGIVDKAVDPEELDEVFAKWRASVNMSASDLKAWRDNECSRKASLNPTAVIDRNLRLLETKKADWDGTHVRAANRAISFIARMRKMEQGEPVGDCPSKRDISLKNWAFDPGKSRSAGGERRIYDSDEAKLRAWEEWDRSVQAEEAKIAKAAKRVLRDLVLAMRRRVRDVAINPTERSAPKRKAIYTEAEIQRLLDINIKEFEDAMQESLDPRIGNMILTSANDIATEITGSVSTYFLSVENPKVVQYLAQKAPILRGIATNLRNEIQRAIVRQISDPDAQYGSIREAIWATLEQSEEYFNATLLSTTQRADLIARTETTAAANFGRMSELEAEGFETSEWFANPGARESHAELSGREVPLGEEFGFGLRYPGDSQAGAAQVANCRCVLIPGTHKDYPDL
jgi:HK97 family phage portal protein